MDRNPRKLVGRSPSLKRRNKPVPLTERIILEKVLGLTVSSNSAFSCDRNTGVVAYPAGCAVVLFNSRKNKQSHIINSSRKTITSLAFSGDGKHLVTGESGHQPCVRVWDMEDHHTQVAEFHGHKFGISCVAFTPNLKYVVSIGFQHDMMVNVWNWRTQTKVASNKISSKVNAISFSEDGSYFVTVGNRHVKFWYLSASNKSRIKETVPLMGRSGILGEQKNNYFCDVGCGRGKTNTSTFVITQSGLLCEFNAKRLLDKWVELRTTSANCITVGEGYIFIGCADGIVRIFDADSMHFISTMPRPHYLGVDVAQGLSPSHMVSNDSSKKYPDTIAVTYDDYNQKVTCIYNDHSIYMWDVKEIRKIGKAWSSLYHSSCIWGLETYPSTPSGGAHPALPSNSFITCSSDDTIRVWNLDSHMSNDTAYKRNIYSQELLKMIYTDPELNHLCDVEYNPAGGTDKTDTNYAGKNGVRSIKVSPDGQHLATGDRLGNIRVFGLQFMDEVALLEAHDSEVLCLEYTQCDPLGVRLLASASRDRLIHVFDVDQSYRLIQTLDDHSSAITAVKFAECGGQLQMLSCGADKSLLFRTAQMAPEFGFVLNKHLVGKTTLYDMDIDPSKKFVATACQDRNVRIYNIRSGKQKKSYKGALGDDGTLIKIQLDRSGSFAATSASDKNLGVFDFYTGECAGSMFGHSEIATGVKFMNNNKHLVSVSGDGCIFVWRVSHPMMQQMNSRLEDLGQIPKHVPVTNDIRRGTFVAQPRVFNPAQNNNNEPSPLPIISDQEFGPPPPNFAEPNGNQFQSTGQAPHDYRFSVGQLPGWAKKQVMSDDFKDRDDAAPNPMVPRGRWAQRVEPQGIVMKSMLDENSAIQLSLADCMDKRRFTFEPDSNKPDDLRRETMVISTSSREPKNIPIIQLTDEEDNDEDDDEEFCPASRAELEKKFNDDANAHSLAGGAVTMSRGSDPLATPKKRTAVPPSKLAVQSPDTDEDDDEDDDDDDEENGDRNVIYYLPTEDGIESPESNASSFKVFALSSDGRPMLRRSLSTASDTTSPRDIDSENTDPTSLDDLNSEEEFSDTPPQSGPNTPLDHKKHFPTTPDKEKFLKHAFENLASATGEQETFGNSIDSMEGDLGDPNRLMHPRLSISSRFLSRSQQTNNNRSAFPSNGQGQPESDSVQKRKNDMAKAVDETRKRLQAEEFTVHETRKPDFIRDPEIEKQRERQRLKEQEKRRGSSGGMAFDIPATKSSMRRSWSSQDVSKSPQLSLPRQNHLNIDKSRHSPTTPTGTTRYVTKTEIKLESPGSGGHGMKLRDRRSGSVQNLSNSTPDATSTPNRRRSTKPPRAYEKQTASSFAKTSKMSRASSATNLTKPELELPSSSYGMKKSSSIQNLTTPPFSRAMNKPEPRRRSRLSSQGTSSGGKGSLSKYKNAYKSTPNLSKAPEDSSPDEEPRSPSEPRTMAEMATLTKSVPDLYDEGIKMELASLVDSTERSSSRESLSSKCSFMSSASSATRPDTARSLTTSPPDSKGNNDTKAASSPSKTSSTLGAKMEKPAVPAADKHAMPPPASTVVPKPKHDSFLRRAARSKRKSMSDLTLAEAKEILLGRTGLLNKMTVVDINMGSEEVKVVDEKKAERNRKLAQLKAELDKEKIDKTDIEKIKEEERFLIDEEKIRSEEKLKNDEVSKDEKLYSPYKEKHIEIINLNDSKPLDTTIIVNTAVEEKQTAGGKKGDKLKELDASPMDLPVKDQSPMKDSQRSSRATSTPLRSRESTTPTSSSNVTITSTYRKNRLSSSGSQSPISTTTPTGSMGNERGDLRSSSSNGKQDLPHMARTLFRDNEGGEAESSRVKGGQIEGVKHSTASGSQPGSPKPDRSKLALQLDRSSTSPEKKSEPAEVAACAQVCEELTTAVQKAAQLYKKISVRDNTPQAQMLAKTFQDIRQTLENIPGEAPSSTTSSGVSAGSPIVSLTPDVKDHMTAIMEPMLEQYSAFLTDKVCELLKEKFDKK